jgi:hypothetical protein
MKRVLLLIAAGLILIPAGKAQKAEIGGFYGISFNTQIRSYYGNFKVDDKANYGGQLSIAMSSQTFVELIYNRTDTRVQYFSSVNVLEPLDIGIEYYQIGGLQQVDIGNDMIKPFGALSLGLTRFHLKDPVDFEDTGSKIRVDDKYTFSASAAGGVKVFLHERIGIRLQARLGVPMLFNGLWIGVGTGGASTGASFHVPLVMFDLSAGVFLRL